MKIYLAGPLFSTAERDFNARLAALLRERGHEVWLPQDSEQETMTPKEIFEKDVEGVDWADAVVANMDGADPDSGTCWECGYAYKKKYIVLFRTDFRIGHEVGSDKRAMPDADMAPYNLMLTESADVRLDLFRADIDDVATEIDAALQSLSR
ncbi:MAG TPA: nucleoside 2-deoxyribosyltransferase [Xanthobacteraceae bacterium]|nr:nucleoside 2-deoxyribosyltransferase [Xanthobacteraceae bacterium]